MKKMIANTCLFLVYDKNLLTTSQFRKLKLDEFVDSFISSCDGKLLKPDADIFRVPFDIAMVLANQSILNMDYMSTSAKLISFGSEVAE